MTLARMAKIIQVRLVIYLIDHRDKGVNQSQIQMQVVASVYLEVATTDLIILKEVS